MSNSQLERRIRAIEAELDRLRQRVEQAAQPWWERIWGSHAGDPTFQEVARLGRHYRKTFRPRARPKAKR